MSQRVTGSSAPETAASSGRVRTAVNLPWKTNGATLLQKYRYLPVSEVRTCLWHLDIGEEMLKQSFVFQACLNAPAILQMPWIGDRKS